MLIRGDREVRLTRVWAEDLDRYEDWLQELLFRHPALIPVDEIEPAFGPLLPVASELSTASGPLDLLFINPLGHITLIETKLWRNPEKRREVVGQIINYATELSKWSYTELVKAVKLATKSQDRDPLLTLARGTTADGFDEAAFTDTVSRNLSRGRFLLLIIGDGIHEAVEEMANYLRQSPHLGFTLNLVEMALFREADAPTDNFFVQPRVLVRTREVTRAIVEIRRGVAGVDVNIETPAEPEPSVRGERPAPLSETLFLEALANSAGSDCARAAREVMEEALAHGLIVDQKPKHGPMLKYLDDATGKSFSFGQIGRDGTFANSGRLSEKCVRQGLPAEIWRDYYEAVRTLIPESRIEAVTEKSTPGSFAEIVSASGDVPPLEPLLRNRKAWFAAIDAAVERVRCELAKRAP